MLVSYGQNLTRKELKLKLQYRNNLITTTKSNKPL